MSTFGTLLVRRGLTYTDIFLLFFSAISPGLLCKCKGRVGGRGETTQIILSSLLWVPKQTWKLMKKQLLISKQRAQHPIMYKKGVELAKRSSAHKYVDPHPWSVQQDLKVLEAIFTEIIKALFESLTKERTSAANCCWRRRAWPLTNLTWGYAHICWISNLYLPSLPFLIPPDCLSKKFWHPPYIRQKLEQQRVIIWFSS